MADGLSGRSRESRKARDRPFGCTWIQQNAPEESAVTDRATPICSAVANPDRTREMAHACNVESLDPLPRQVYLAALAWLDSRWADRAASVTRQPVFAQGDPNLANHRWDGNSVDFEASGRGDRATELADFAEHTTVRALTLKNSLTASRGTPSSCGNCLQRKHLSLMRDSVKGWAVANDLLVAAAASLARRQPGGTDWFVDSARAVTVASVPAEEYCERCGQLARLDWSAMTSAELRTRVCGYRVVVLRGELDTTDAGNRAWSPRWLRARGGPRE